MGWPRTVPSVQLFLGKFHVHFKMSKGSSCTTMLAGTGCTNECAVWVTGMYYLSLISGYKFFFQKSISWQNIYPYPVSLFVIPFFDSIFIVCFVSIKSSDIPIVLYQDVGQNAFQGWLIILWFQSHFTIWFSDTDDLDRLESSFAWQADL